MGPGLRLGPVTRSADLTPFQAAPVGQTTRSPPLPRGELVWVDERASWLAQARAVGAFPTGKVNLK
jgi:hypothetical protein